MSHIFVIDADSFDGVVEQLTDAKTTMTKSLKKVGVEEYDGPDEVRIEAKKDPTSFAIIINGYSLVRNLYVYKT